MKGERRSVRSGKQISSADAERLCQNLDDLYRWVASGTLDVTHIGPVNASLVGKRLLAQRFGLAQAPDIGREAMLDVHAATQTPLQPINLQTMSHIALSTAPSERLPIASLIFKLRQTRLWFEGGN